MTAHVFDLDSIVASSELLTRPSPKKEAADYSAASFFIPFHR